MAQIQVRLPYHLQLLAKTESVIWLDVDHGITQRCLIDALEQQYPELRGTIRDHQTQLRRPYVRFFACGRDLSHDAPDANLPEAVADGTEPFSIVGAISGG